MATSSFTSCEVCATETGIVADLAQHFRVSVCWDCKQLREEYKLVTKTTATSHFFVPERVLRAWPCLEKDNPKHEGWGKMKLYLRRSAMEWAYRKYDGPDGLERERHARAVRRQRQQANRSTKKRKQYPLQYSARDNFEDDAHDEDNAGGEGGREKKKKRAALSLGAMLRREHKQRRASHQQREIVISSDDDGDSIFSSNNPRTRTSATSSCKKGDDEDRSIIESRKKFAAAMGHRY